MSHRINGQRGVSVVEVLVAISLLAISGLAVAQSTIRAFASLNQSYRTSLASQIALDRIELLTTRDPSTIDLTLNETNTTITQSNSTFYRSTTVTINPDGSRSIVIVVTSPAGFTGKASLSTTLPLWGNS